MNNRLLQFEPSLADVEGLTSFEANRLPLWFRERMLSEHAPPMPVDASDPEILDVRLLPWGEGTWFFGWGTADIDASEVLILDSDMLVPPVAFANDWGLGVRFVEPADDFEVGHTVYFTAAPKRRKQVAG